MFYCISAWESNGIAVLSDKTENKTIVDNSSGDSSYTIISELYMNKTVAPQNTMVQCTSLQGEPYNYEVKSGVYDISHGGTFY